MKYEWKRLGVNLYSHNTGDAVLFVSLGRMYVRYKTEDGGILYSKPWFKKVDKLICIDSTGTIKYKPSQEEKSTGWCVTTRCNHGFDRDELVKLAIQAQEDLFIELGYLKDYPE